MLVWGLGNMGSGIVRTLAGRRGVTVVGGVCTRGDKEGKDIGELCELGAPLGTAAIRDGNFATQLTKPDVVVVAQSSTVAESMAAIETSLAYACDVVCIAEEMAYPWRSAPDLASTIDEMARRVGKTVVGTGVNPGFVLDTLIVALTGCCVSVERVTARRVNDLSAYGPTVMSAQGVGLSPEAFAEAVEAGDVVGHVGFGESMSMIADAVGWKLTRIEESREPVVSTVRRETPHAVVEPGMVAGCRQRAWGFVGDRVVIELDHPQQVRPEAEGIATSDSIQISGEPPISMTIEPEISGGPATIALACNTIPLAVRAAPGLVSMTDLPVPRASVGDMRLWLKKSRERGRLHAARPAEEAESGGESGAGEGADLGEAERDASGDYRSGARADAGKGTSAPGAVIEPVDSRIPEDWSEEGWAQGGDGAASGGGTAAGEPSGPEGPPEESEEDEE